MTDTKTVYSLNNLSFEELMQLKFGLQERIGAIKRNYIWEGMREASRQYWEGELAASEQLLSKWEDLRHYEFISEEKEVA